MLEGVLDGEGATQTLNFRRWQQQDPDMWCTISDWEDVARYRFMGTDASESALWVQTGLGALKLMLDTLQAHICLTASIFSHATVGQDIRPYLVLDPQTSDIYALIDHSCECGDSGATTPTTPPPATSTGRGRTSGAAPAPGPRRTSRCPASWSRARTSRSTASATPSA
mmetsp:Transcript_36935/g.114964  ORF Transcript_36935/g.114964 Transcript_36935/m.114964 type:complete len:169 (+) Transcript_36935:3-509(+)